VWAKETAGRDIYPLVVTYSLTDDGRDFESLEVLPVFEASSDFGQRGTVFLYDGKAYPLATARGVCVHASGRFEICGAYDYHGEPWFEIRDLATGETLFLSGALLLAVDVLPTEEGVPSRVDGA